MQFEVIVRGIVKHDGRLLVGLKRRDDPHPLQGKWHFPGGRLEYDESPWRAVEREIEEETGYMVEAVELIDVVPKFLIWPEESGIPPQQTLHVIFACRLKGGNARPGDDVEEVRWITGEEVDEVLQSEFLLESERVRQFVRQFVSFKG